MNLGTIKWLVVIVCIAVAMISGFVWYHPKLFYPAWRQGIGNHLLNFLIFGRILAAWHSLRAGPKGHSDPYIYMPASGSGRGQKLRHWLKHRIMLAPI